MSNDPPPNHGDDRSESLNDSAAEKPTPSSLPPHLAQFEQVYRAEFGHVAAYFARRTLDPQFVADLTADTFVAAIQSLDTLNLERASARAWILGIARRVYLRYRESDPRTAERQGLTERMLDAEEAKELTWRIEIERSSRELIGRLERMSALDREAVELVDLCGLTHVEAARELGISSGALRVRLARARARLKRESASDDV
jgi:RNA polymerase sigma factor (sigma-70 family)